MKENTTDLSFNEECNGVLQSYGHSGWSFAQKIIRWIRNWVRKRQVWGHTKKEGDSYESFHSLPPVLNWKFLVWKQQTGKKIW